MDANHPLRILIVEDVPSDAELAERELRNSGLQFTSVRVDTKEGFLKALEEFQPHLVISDYAMPEFDGMQALKLSLEHDARIPFIILTGSMNEETAVACMKAGATDYVIKDHLPRLPFAVREALAKKAVEEELAESEKRYRLFVETAKEGVWSMDSEYCTTFVNKATGDMLGYEPDEMLGRRVDTFMFPEDLVDHSKKMEDRKHGRDSTYERRFRCKNGKTVWVIVSARVVLDEQGNFAGSFAMVTDITDRKQAEEALRIQSESFLQVLDGLDALVYVIDMKTYEIVFINKYGQNIWGDINGTICWQTIQRGQAGPCEFCTNSKIVGPDGKPAEGIVWEFKNTVTERWFDCRDRAIYWPDGRIVRMEIATDITERKKNEQLLKQTLEKLRKAVSTTIQVMVSAVEVRDPYTAGHQNRVADLSRGIGKEMGLSHEKIEAIRMAGPIHDIGKLSIPAEILSKPTKLTNIEFALVKEHSRIGYEILKHVESPWPLAEIVYQHHERMDGSGYPRNLKGDAIIMEARILAVADVVESMASHRPYRPALGIDAALKEIEKNRGIFYDNAVAGACLKLFREKGFILEGA